MATAMPMVILHKQLGDILLLEPALARLAAASGSDVMLATRPGFSPMLSLMEHVRPLPEGNFRRASMVISFDPRSRACMQALTTWAPEKRLIVTREKHLKPWHRLFFPQERSAVDESAYYRGEYYFRLMPEASGMPFRPPQLRPPPADWMPKGLPAHYVLLHTTSAWPSKSWLPESWAATIDALDREGIGPFVLTGGNAQWETEYVASIAAATRVKFINLCGKTTLREYLAIVANAHSLLCIDGSSSHIASAFRRPAVTLFGPSHPLHWFLPTPWSRLVDARSFVADKKPAASHIPPDAVITAYRELTGSC